MNPPNPSPPPAPKILRRPTHDRKLAGVAKALADYLAIDPTIVRILFVVCGFLGGSGVILYLAGAILIPSEDGTGVSFTTIDTLKRDRSAATIVGLIVAAIGSIVLLGELSDSDLIAPLLLVAVGCGLLLWKSGPTETAVATTAPGTSVAGTGYAPPPAPQASTGVSAFGTVQEQAPIYPDAGEPIPPAPQVGSAGDIPWVPPQTPQAQHVPMSEPKPKRQKSKLTWVALAGLFVYFGIAIVLNASGVNIDGDRTIAWGLAAVGGVLAYSAFFGRARSLIFIGLLMIPIMFAAGEANFDDGFNFDFETNRVKIIGVDELNIQTQEYDTGVGSVEYDLRSIELNGETETISIDHGVGEVLVRVPSGIELDIEASAGAGDVDVLGRTADGPGAEVSYGSGSGTSEGKLILDIEVGLGTIEVTK